MDILQRITVRANNLTDVKYMYLLYLQGTSCLKCAYESTSLPGLLLSRHNSNEFNGNK